MTADYTYTIEEASGRNVLAIIDSNLGGKSLTNDIDNVTDAILRNNIVSPNIMIVYRDSEGIWDGYDFKNGQFIHLGKSTWREAVTRYIQIQLTQSNH